MPELSPTPKLLSGRKLPAKLMVVQTTYYCLPDKSPFGIDTRSTRWLSSAQDLVAAEGIDVQEEWTPIRELIKTIPQDFRIGTVIVESLVGKDLQVVPGVEERERIYSSIIEVRIGRSDVSGVLLVYPGATERITPYAGNDLTLRCVTGIARCNIYVIPK